MWIDLAVLPRMERGTVVDYAKGRTIIGSAFSLSCSTNKKIKTINR
jgi:hypothetical protein